MDHKLLACSECSTACLTIHKNKRDPNPIVVSFFKVMFGNQFSEVLIVPPKFAKTIVELDGKRTYFEDSTGQKWEVNLTNLDGSLAFKKGWHEFVVDHDIKQGDLLVFNYFKGLYFNVQIFGKSGCEKPMIFGGKDYQNNRAKVTRDSVPTLDCCYSSCNDLLANDFLTTPNEADVFQRKEDVVNVRKSPEIGVNDPVQETTNKRLKVNPTADFLVESYFMTDRNNASSDNDRDISLFDLSIFEMPRKVETGNRCYKTNALQITQFQVAEDEEDWLRKEPESLPTKAIARVDVPLNVSMPVKSVDFPRMFEFSEPTTSSQLSSERKRIVKQEPNSEANVSKTDNLSWDSTIQSTTKHHKLNDTNFDTKLNSTSVEEDKGRTDIIVNLGALNFCDSPETDVKITCLVNHDSEFSLELPKALPVQVCTEGENSEQKLVVLRDPVGRLWPVIYHQREGIHILANGWKEFRKSNSIQAGDECTFTVENIGEGIQVQICRRCQN